MSRMKSSGINLDLQFASSLDGLPSEEEFGQWVAAAIKGRSDKSDITIRVVDESESRRLNQKYRGQDGATNVLSFPIDLPPQIDMPLLGDLVICAPVVASEVREQGKMQRHHWAHLCIHGVLHLIGMDHQNDNDADKMEDEEVAILATLGIPDPYQ